jgi:hypothetical protein
MAEQLLDGLQVAGGIEHRLTGGVASHVHLATACGDAVLARSRDLLQRASLLRLLVHPSQNRPRMADDRAVGEFERR